MMQDWSPDAMRFMRDAASRSDYHKRLAAHIAPHLPPDADVCDAGCGMGDLALALAPHCKTVTAVDRASAPIEALRARPLPHNLRTSCTDIFTLEQRFDAMVFCYFGRMQEILDVSARLCRKTVVVVKRRERTRLFSVRPTPTEHRVAEQAEIFLRERGIPFQSECLALELGQPFRSVEEAERFFALYNRADAPISRAELLRRLQLRDDAEFPYYLPALRQMVLLVLDADSIREGSR